MTSDEEDIEITQTQYRTLKFIANNPGKAHPEGISNKFDIVRSSGSRRIDPLLEKDLVEKRGRQSTHQNYAPTKRGYKFFDVYRKTQPDRKMKFRLHKILVKFPVVTGLENIREKLPLRDKIEVTNDTWIDRTLPEPYDDIHYQINSQNLLIHVPEKASKPTDTGIGKAYTSALKEAEELKEIIKEIHPDLKVGRGEPSYADSHAAFVNDPRALVFEKLDGTDGVIEELDLDFHVDRSTGTPELEVEEDNSEEKAINLGLNLDTMTKTNIAERIKQAEKRLDNLEEAVEGGM